MRQKQNFLKQFHSVWIIVIRVLGWTRDATRQVDGLVFRTVPIQRVFGHILKEKTSSFQNIIRGSDELVDAFPRFETAFRLEVATVSRDPRFEIRNFGQKSRIFDPFYRLSHAQHVDVIKFAQEIEKPKQWLKKNYFIFVEISGFC